MKWGIWLLPEKRKEIFLEEIITSLSRKYSTSSFKPHLTLLAFWEEKEKEKAYEKFDKIASFFQPLKLKSFQIGIGKSYFQCVFFLIEKDPSLVHLREKGEKILSLSPTPYMPHISLIYGNLPLNEKKEIQEKLSLFLPQEFYFPSLALYLLEGDPFLWKKEKEFLTE